MERAFNTQALLREPSKQKHQIHRLPKKQKIIDKVFMTISEMTPLVIT